MHKTFLICHPSDRMTNPSPNHLHIQRQTEHCPGAIAQGLKKGGDHRSHQVTIGRGAIAGRWVDKIGGRLPFLSNQNRDE
jgi:hypothetical protein